MRNTGENLIMDDNYAVDSIRPKCIELQRMCDQYRQLVRQRREILQKSGDLQDRIDKVRKLMYNSGLSIRGGTRYFYLPKMVFGTFSF